MNYRMRLCPNGSTEAIVSGTDYKESKNILFLDLIQGQP